MTSDMIRAMYSGCFAVKGGCADVSRGSNALMINRNFHLLILGLSYFWLGAPYGWNTITLYIFLSLYIIGQSRPWPVCAHVQARQLLRRIYTGYFLDHCALTRSMRCFICNICSLTHFVIHFRTIQDTSLVRLSYVTERAQMVYWYYFLFEPRWDLSGLHYMLCIRTVNLRQTHLWKPRRRESVKQPKPCLGCQYAQAGLGICCLYVIICLLSIKLLLLMTCKPSRRESVKQPRPCLGCQYAQAGLGICCLYVIICLLSITPLLLMTCKPSRRESVKQPRPCLGCQYAQAGLGICCLYVIICSLSITPLLLMTCKPSRTTALCVWNTCPCVSQNCQGYSGKLSLVTRDVGIFFYTLSKNPDISDGLNCNAPNIAVGQEALCSDNKHQGPVVGSEDRQHINGPSCLVSMDYFTICVPYFPDKWPLFFTFIMIIAKVVVNLNTLNMIYSSDPDEILRPVATRSGPYCIPRTRVTVIYVNVFCTIVINPFLNE